MTQDETNALDALNQLLDLTDSDDWHMVHATVAEDVRVGKYGRDFEAKYRALVDKKLSESGQA